MLEVFLFGLLSYADALRLQRRLVFEVSGSHGQLAALVLCEHYPIITVGRLGSRSHIDCDDAELAARGIALQWVNRGGGCNLHLPGQLVAYPIWPFDTNHLDFREYLVRLECCLRSVLREFDVIGTSRPDHTAICTPAGQIATIGVSVSRWVSYHGMTLNVSGVKERYRILNPDGGGSRRVTTMEAERQRPAPMAKVRECLVNKFIETFEPARYNLYTRHPMFSQPGRAKVYARSS